MVGVSWILAAKENKERVQECEIRLVEGDEREKGWISSILKDEKQDVIGLQETKVGWLMIYGLRIFGECKEAIGDERFIAVMSSWKGKSEEMFL
ncbi:hypothetical protein Tco_1072939, partial [Tanacetum coccineum]